MTSKQSKKKKQRFILSAVLQDGSIIETILLPRQKLTAFVVWQDNAWRIEESVVIDGMEYFPYSAKNNLIRHKVLLLPETPEEYHSQEVLIAELEAFIHKYVDVSPLYEKLVSYYILLTWIYDRFHELPYLRLKGDPGTGKTRFLLTVGSLCYKPIFASGASTVSPLFRMLDTIRGTLILDEGDFRFTDERAEIVKILNNGNARGFPVLRSEVTPWGEYNPHAFYVYGPKLVATRKSFDDLALESRCITEEMGTREFREDVPINLTEVHAREATSLRNKLLLFRFRNYHSAGVDQSFEKLSVEPRLKQVLMPLFSVIRDENTREELIDFASEQNADMAVYRGMQIEAQVLTIISGILEQGETKPSIPEITSWFQDRYGEEYDNKVTARTIGKVIRGSLQIRMRKSGGSYLIPVEEYPKLEWLIKKYRI